MPKFILVMRGNYSIWESIEVTVKQNLLKKYQEYFQEVKANYNFQSGAHLSNVSSKFETIDGEIKFKKEAYKNTNEALNGYFVIEVESIEKANEIARKCPCLTHGESIEVILID
ncbi:MAG: hypothetical protein DWQ06_07790 [Calditrichaeota bacterium]|nr:MAG: hypothetical protein DWQ06_07790 [Calditrichota bacterium]